MTSLGMILVVVMAFMVLDYVRAIPGIGCPMPGRPQIAILMIV
jgi:hypothetical protein